MVHDAQRPLSAAALRMQRSRARRRNGPRTIRFSIRDREIEALVQRRLLARGRQEDPVEIARALGRLMDQVMRREERAACLSQWGD